MKRLKYISCVFLLFTIAISCKVITFEETIAPEHKLMIYKGDSYASFTDLYELNGSYYCVFRQGSNHVGGTYGKIVIIESCDGVNWKIFREIEMENKDIRDPCFINNNDGELHVSFFSIEDIDNKKILSNFFSKISLNNNKSFKSITTKNIVLDNSCNNFVLWHITRYNNECYAVAYNNKSDAVLLKSTDDQHFEKVCVLENTYDPKIFLNECSLLFDKIGKLFIVARTLQDNNAIFAEANYPYTEWKQAHRTMWLGGPKLKLFGDDVLLGTRSSDGATTIYTISKKVEELEISPIINTNQYGDSGYPGMIRVGNELWVSYYVGNSAYGNNSGSSDIYIARKKIWN